MKRRTSSRRHPLTTLAALVALGSLVACGTMVSDGAVVGPGAVGPGSGQAGQAASQLGSGTGLAPGSVTVGGAAGGGGAAATGERSTAPGPGGAGGGSDSAAASAGPTISDQGVTDSEIIIGATGPLSGVTGFLGEEAFGAIDSYFQLVNSQGGVNGRMLRLIAYDDRFDSSQQAANFRRLNEEEGVLAMFAVFSDAVGQYVTRNNIPTLVFGVTAPSFSSQFPTVFPLVGNALLWTQEIVEGLKQQGVFKEGMRVGMLYDTEVLDVSPYLPYLVESWEHEGAEVVSTDPFNFSSGDCTSLVLKMKDLNIDYWDFQGLGWVLCASAAQRQQYRPPLGWGGWPTSVAGLASQVGPWVDGIWGGAQGDQPNGAPRGRTAAHEEYESAIARFHPNIASFNHLESPPTIGYWVGARLLVDALKAQGPVVTRQGLIDWIAAVDTYDTGITPPIISMKPNCKTGSEAVWIGRWRWDADKKEATRVPESGYFTTPRKEDLGGKCFLTALSDKIMGGG